MDIYGKDPTLKPKPMADFASEEDMVGEAPMPKPKPKQINPSPDLMKLLGGIGDMGKQREINDNPNGDWQYTDDRDMTTRYVPISQTYKPLKYEGPTYEEGTYESPTYEPATQMLFGEQGKSWENSPVFRETGIGKVLNERGDEKSIMDSDEEVKKMLFGGGNEPVVDDNKPNAWFQDANVAPLSNQIAEPTVVTPSMAEIMAKINLPQIPNVPTVYTPPTMPMPTQPIYSRSLPTTMPQLPTKNKGGRPKGSKNRPPPGGIWNRGVIQPK